MLRFGLSLKKTFGDEWDGALLASLGRAGVETLEIDGSLFMGAGCAARFAAVEQARKNGGPAVSSVHVPYAGFDISAPDRDSRYVSLKNAIDSVKIAQRLGAGTAVIHASGEPIAASERTERLYRARGALAEICGHASHAGVRVAVEFLPRTCLGNSVDELLSLLEGLPARTAGVCLDVNHLMNNSAALPKVIGELGPLLFAMHLSDYDGVDEKHWLPGRGVIDWRAMVRALEKTGFDGPFNYECGIDEENSEKKIALFADNFKWLTGKPGKRS